MKQLSDAPHEPRDSSDSGPAPLPAAALFRATDPASLGFATTAELPDLDEIVGQQRAVDAVAFALGMRRLGYNLFALGPEGIGKYTVIRQSLERAAADEPVPPDWCYVHDFGDPQRPRALRLPAGRGVQFRSRMDRLATEFRGAIRAAFESDRYRTRKEAVEEEFTHHREAALEAFDKRANEVGIALIRTPAGIGLAPTKGGEALDAERFHKLPQEEQERVRAAIGALEDELAALLRQVPRWEREARERIGELDRETTREAVDHLIDEVRKDFADLSEVVAYLDAVEADVIVHAAEFLASGAQETETPAIVRGLVSEAAASRRYAVNLLIDHAETTGAPVVYEDNPTYNNLIGRVEHVSQLGALLTDFTLIRPGALHRANGGYLVLDARKVLSEPLAWEALKRALRSSEVAIESIGQLLSVISTVSLEPRPIPLSVKVVLVGDRRLHALLAELDPDFPELFKVQADFDEEIDRAPETDRLYARLAGRLARTEGLRPLDAGAVARLIEYAARLAGDAEKVSTQMRSLTDLLREADHLAGDAGRTILEAADVQRAIDGRHRRAGRMRDRIQEEIARGTLLVDTAGAVVGQVNGLTVAGLGEVPFGWPARITARVRLGRGELIDIEREVELGGPIHSKGVLILAGFLGGRYADRQPLGLHASLVFEQSYGEIEGDSASLGELCALLSAIGELPIQQSFAVTGSVNQHGRVQPIGGVNEKIEGFFDVCTARGLTGAEGVIVPASNVRHLMLRSDVVEAAAAGRFRVHAVETVDEALELLTGLPAGERGPDGAWPADSANGRIAAKLVELNETWREYGDGQPKRRERSRARARKPARKTDRH